MDILIAREFRSACEFVFYDRVWFFDDYPVVSVRENNEWQYQQRNMDWIFLCCFANIYRLFTILLES